MNGLLTHLLSVPVVDLVDVAEDHLVLALHALGERGLLQRREVPVDYQPEVPHVILLRLDQLRDDEPATRRHRVLQPAEGRGGTTGRGTGRYNRWRNGAIQPAEGRGISTANYGVLQGAL